MLLLITFETLKITVRANTQLYYNSFLPSVVREWNSLTDLSRNAATLESFKMSLNMDTVNKPPSHLIITLVKGEAKHITRGSEPNVVHEMSIFFRKGINTDPNRVCGAVETTKHFLLECNAFIEIRKEMLKEIHSFSKPTLDYVLYGSGVTSITQVYFSRYRWL